MRHHSEPQGEIHHVALIRHRDIQRWEQEVTGSQTQGAHARVPHLRVSLV